MDWIDVAQDRVVGFCEHGYEPSGFRKMQVISWLAEDILASQEGLCSMVFVCTIFLKSVFWKKKTLLPTNNLDQ